MIWVALRDDLNHGLARDETNNGCVGDYARRRPNRDASVTDHCLRDSYFSLQSIYLTMHFFFAYMTGIGRLLSDILGLAKRISDLSTSIKT